MKMIFAIIIIIPSISNAQINAKEEFGEHAAMFVGSCLSLDLLKKRHCPNINSIDYKTCIRQAEDLLPQRLKSEFRSAMTQSDSYLRDMASSGIDQGFAKSLSIASSDRNLACTTYGTSINTVIHMKHEEIKRIATRVN